MGKLHIDLLGTSFTVQANEDSEYLEKLLDYYTRITQEVSGLKALTNPLQASILAGIMVCDELYKLMDKNERAEKTNGIREDLNITQAQEQAEAEKRTLGMINKINSVLENSQQG